MPMTPCESCGRHHLDTEASCPFCDKPAPRSKIFRLGAGMLTTLVLAACYGAPPLDDSGIDTDADADADADADSDADADADGDADADADADTDTGSGS